jgi:UDP-2,3-diacylglucosamine pyrophosphatase LpxH
MLVVLSDLHFSEAQSSKIGQHRFNRNLLPETYLAYFTEINQLAKANQISDVDLVLAGDILEISRSSIWLDGDDRPYIYNEAVLPDSGAEKTILKIVDAIAQEENVSATLSLFRHIHEYFDMDVHLHLMLGNHDRLLNATPKIREEVRKLFGLEGGAALIKHHLVMKDLQGNPFCLVRHGHEYDPTNFSLNIHEMDIISTEIPELYYGKACLGDITSIEFGASLSWLFIKRYGEEKILRDATLMALYQRLMEFDDVRPTTAWLSYLFSTPGVSQNRTWQLMKPCFTEIINTLSKHDQFNRALSQSAAMSKFLRFLLLMILKAGIFRNGIPFWMIKTIMKIASKSIKLKSQVKFAKLEELIQNDESGCKCVVSGHSHFAEVSLLSAVNGDERYYINTGTWRNVIPATKDYQEFGRLKALTKVIVFYPMERRDLPEGHSWAFYYLSGVSYGEHRHL